VSVKVCVLGGGGWGTAISILLAGKGDEVTLWTRREEHARAMTEERYNRDYLPGVPLPRTLHITSDMDQAVEDAEFLIVAVPSHGVRDVLRRLPRTKNDTVFVSLTKGIEVDTLLRMSEVIVQETGSSPRKVAALSGPNFALEVARGLPTASVAACVDEDTARRVQDAFMTERFRVYSHTDVLGVELGGALKNIYAIGVGIIDGMNIGQNARAAFMTRSVAELARLGLKMGANPLTFAGLSGLGDLVLTCTGELSRNRRCGILIGQGKRLEDVLAETRMVVEGVNTTRAARRLAAREGVAMPIVEQIYSILFEGAHPGRCLDSLMTRMKRRELDEMMFERSR